MNELILINDYTSKTETNINIRPKIREALLKFIRSSSTIRLTPL